MTKNKFLNCFVLLVFCGAFPLQSQRVDVENFLQKDDLCGLICEFGGDEVSTLEALSKYRPSDTIAFNQVWYNVSNGLEGISSKYNLSFYEGYAASWRLKAYYWMIKIFRMEYDINEEEVCFFSIWDYDKIKGVYPIAYVRNKKYVAKIDSIDSKVQEWVEMIKIRGLKDVRVSWHPPFHESDYRIYKPLNKWEFYRKCQNFRYECK